MSATSGRVSPSPTSSRRCSPGRSRARRRRCGSRSLRALEGARGSGAVRRPPRDPTALRRGAVDVRWRRHTAGSPPRAFPRRDRLLDRVPRPRALDRRRSGLGGPAAAIRPTGVRAAQRCGVQRGLGLGGGHVRRPSRAVESRGHRRRQRTAGSRLYTGRARPRPLRERWSSFGWHVHEVDGHDVDALAAAFASSTDDRDRPHVVLAATTFGKGVSYMESQIKWHYWPMSDEEYAVAVGELEAARR